jgi:hypothetical protein
MTSEQKIRRNALSGAGVKRSWADPEIRERRTAAIKAAWDCPLLRAIERARRERHANKCR